MDMTTKRATSTHMHYANWRNCNCKVDTSHQLFRVKDACFTQGLKSLCSWILVWRYTGIDTSTKVKISFLAIEMPSSLSVPGKVVLHAVHICKAIAAVDGSCDMMRHHEKCGGSHRALVLCS
jgi:hypothetical protein